MAGQGGHRQFEAGHEDHDLQPPERIIGPVGVHGGERSPVPGTHRLHHVERLGATHLADHNPVGSHAQGIAYEVADGDLADALDSCVARLQPHDMWDAKVQLGGVFDCDDALAVWDRSCQRVEQRRLP